ncbi:hypothetical protein BDP27DRAFT_1360430 [Rhodocollybia butyracea]|uniref:Uncharacterized protein n=1 Tax=Rhodocollybia butyracea TaxID=206335 RepID=A0A9P5Q223_9AGAR|nr:hypothetical protein BDP27DRAFT_1360430 [Rhodocollybia butyracea]
MTIKLYQEVAPRERTCAQFIHFPIFPFVPGKITRFYEDWKALSLLARTSVAVSNSVLARFIGIGQPRRTLDGFQPFDPVPDFLLAPSPIQYDIYRFSSAGFTIKGNLPKSPGELLQMMSDQYVGKQVDRFGQPLREYSDSDDRDELEDKLFTAMSARPPPQIPNHIYEIEAEMRRLWIEAAAGERVRISNLLVAQGHNPDSDPVLAQLMGRTTLVDQFFDDTANFFATHLPLQNSVVVLENVDEDNLEIGVYEIACDRYGMRVQKVPRPFNLRGRGSYPTADFVIGKDAFLVNAKASELRGSRWGSIPNTT